MIFRVFLIAAFVAISGWAATALPPDTLSPRQVVRRFDSLLNVGADAKAKAFCAGTALRMFPFLVEAQHKLDPFLDSARSKDTVIEEKQKGRWSALKIVSDAVFTKPLMGMDRIHSIQAVHLFREPGGWKLAEFEELRDERSPLVLRSGIPTGVDTASPGPLFPVSRLAPEHRGATRLRLKISLRNGDSLPTIPEGPGQKVLKRGKDWAIIETSRPLPPNPPEGGGRGGREVSNPASSSSMSPPSGGREEKQQVEGATTGRLDAGPDTIYLDLTDSLLLTKAAELRKGAGDNVEVTRRIYNFVSTSFHFKLGAALFGTSREVVRSMEGDCSEAAVLTAALLRAEGIPSRVVLGFATLSHGVFIGHAWAEAYLNGQWIGVDAALREFPAGAERVALLRLSSSEDMRVAASNLMLQSLSNLNIEITDAWSGSKPLKLVEQRGNAAEAQAFFEEVLQGVGN